MRNYGFGIENRSTNRGRYPLRIDKFCQPRVDINCHVSAMGEASVRHSGTRIACNLLVLHELYEVARNNTVVAQGLLFLSMNRWGGDGRLSLPGSL